MTRRSAIAGVVLALTAWGKGKEWQEGVLDSFELREIPVKKSVQQYFVYRIRGANVSYMVEFRHPLKAIVHDPVKFAVDKDSLILKQDNGDERKATILEKERIGN
jgi:hypothetical protein